ncbi:MULTISPECIES: helix-turn-helix domain-containing protein [Asticcacaulis]|uniref:helix-turn-helix domain-containing protein n=1 Tax=Asticcacaulis TaxID=76890 RepID=UPI001AE6B7B6|nr:MULTISPECIES: helix-turn-helix domain-containing protein [Asticcacaulis]MBP2157491.1 excisionase family DNA binding protein [Asticcacaulis solisilvae]MDR6798536.1 excisionase family DNA binding protein [Asticcacaulis sp. BE141]
MKKQAATKAQNCDAYFTVAEVADRHKVSPRQIRRLIDRGDLPTTRFGRSVRISLGDLLAFEHSARAGR